MTYSETTEQNKTTLLSRNITVKGKRTSVRLELEMWRALKEISERENCTIHDICTLIKMRKNPLTSLTAAIRVFLMLYFRASSNEKGHVEAGHGDFDSMIKRARVPEEDVKYFSVRKAKPAEAIKKITHKNVSYHNENYAQSSA